MFSVIDVHESGDGLTYVEDVFSAFTYTGNGSTQSIVNGIDLAGKGGLVWTKRRTAANHTLINTDRGNRKFLFTNDTSAEQESANDNDLSAFNSDGYSLGSGFALNLNVSAATYIGWTFRKAKKFFDVKTYTGNGVAGRQIAHDLGVAPGMIIVKSVSSNNFWGVYHRSIGSTQYLLLNLTDASGSLTGMWNNTDPTDSVFTLGDSSIVNGGGQTYIAYIFAHDTTADGIIQCGSFSANTDINLGWEPQFVITKAFNTTSEWRMLDTSRTWNLSTSDALLKANASDAEATGTDYGSPNASGFSTLNHPANFVYLAIRKGLMRPPTDASKVFDIVARTGTGAAATITTPGIKTGVDMLIVKQRSATRAHMWSDRLRGTSSQLTSDSTAAETTVSTGVTSFNMDGASVGTLNTVNVSSGTYINYFFKQARGLFDIVGYTGTGAARTVPHNLGAVPELMIVKRRNAVSNWPVYYGTPTRFMYLNNSSSDDPDGADRWNLLSPTDSLINLGAHADVNASGGQYIAYLFTSCPGVLKTGTFAGNGTTINIPCGFASGARFVLMRDIGGGIGWQYCDTTRGIVSGSDPALMFNSTGAEFVIYDTLQPLVGGFGVNYESTFEFNKSGRNYWYMAIA